MTRHVVFLRGVNIRASNRVSMPRLRQLLTDEGYDGVATYMQSGNIVLSSAKTAEQVAADVNRLLDSDMGVRVAIVTRTGTELADVVKRDPFGPRAANPKLYQVTFLEHEASPDLQPRLAAMAAPGEEAVVIGREVFTWHGAGIARSAIWNFLASRSSGIVGTTRNWATVNALVAMASR